MTLRCCLVVTAILLAPALRAQLQEEYAPPPSRCCLASAAINLTNGLQDWDQIGRYHEDDEKVRKAPADPNRVVFLGDSITDYWKLADFFPGRNYINRGISGQVTAQMLVRMYPDVIDLKPAAMVLLAGTNDIARNNGPETLQMIEENIMAMAELANAHGIKVILCSVTPIADYGKVKMSEGRPPAQILELNKWLKEYAAKTHAIYADYFDALADPKGMLRPGISADGLHPNDQGYALMVPAAQAAIDLALKK